MRGTSRRYLHAGLILLLTGCGLSDAARLLQDATLPPGSLAGRVAEREERIGDLRVRRYGAGPRIVLVHGAVEDGIDDPRFVLFARALALRGFEVVTPELESLCRFRIDPGDPARIARAAGGERATLAGISIGGSYCLVAAASADVRCVFCFGGYADLEELVMRWLTHPAEGPPELLDPLREGRRRVLLGNRDRLDDDAVARAMASEEPLPEEQARRLIAPVEGDFEALSPVRRPATGAPVFLLHANEDPVVPAADARTLAKHYGNAELLVTDLFGHVGAERAPGFWEALPLLGFLSDFLGAAR